MTNWGTCSNCNRERIAVYTNNSGRVLCATCSNLDTVGALETQTARFTRSDGKVQVRAFWAHRGGSLWLGEVTVNSSALGTMRFSSTTPMTADGLAGYATDDYLARHAARFVAPRY